MLSIIIFMLTSVIWQLPYFMMGRVCITINLLIDQKIILYLLLHEIICLDDDENFLVGMHLWCHLFAGAFTFNMYWSDINMQLGQNIRYLGGYQVLTLQVTMCSADTNSIDSELDEYENNNTAISVCSTS